MAVYLNGSRMKALIDGSTYSIKMQFNLLPTTNDLLLASSDGLIFQGSNGLYLALKTSSRLRSLDNYALKDSNGLYLTQKEVQ